MNIGKKGFSILLSTLLFGALFSSAMGGLFYTASANAESVETTGAIEKMQVNLSENIKFKFNATVPDGATDVKMKFSFNGKETTVSDYTDTSDGYKMFVFDGVTPQHLNDEVTMTLLYTEGGEQKSVVKTTSVKTYCEKLAATDEFGVESKRLAVDILNYGAAAQVYLQEDVEHLANADLTEEQQALATSFEYVKGSLRKDTAFSDESNGDILWQTANLRFDYNVSMAFKFSLGEGVTADNLTLKALKEGETEKTELTLEENNGVYLARYTALSAVDFDKTVTVQAYNGGEAIGSDLTYSVRSYVSNYVDSTTPMGKLAQATYVYGKSVEAYAAPLPEVTLNNVTISDTPTVELRQDGDQVYIVIDSGTMDYAVTSAASGENNPLIQEKNEREIKQAVEQQIAKLYYSDLMCTATGGNIPLGTSTHVANWLTDSTFEMVFDVTEMKDYAGADYMLHFKRIGTAGNNDYKPDIEDFTQTVNVAGTTEGRYTLGKYDYTLKLDRANNKHWSLIYLNVTKYQEINVTGAGYPTATEDMTTSTDTTTYTPTLELRQDGGKVYIVIGNGKVDYNVVGYTPDEAKSVIEQKIADSFYSEVMSRESLLSLQTSRHTATLLADDTFEILVDVTNVYESATLNSNGVPKYSSDKFFLKFIHKNANGTVPSNKDFKPGIDTFTQDPVTVGDYKYTFIYDKSTCWGMPFVTVTPVITVKSMAMEARDGKAVVVLTGDYTNLAEAALKTLTMSFEKYNIPDLDNGRITMAYTYVLKEDGTFEIAIDVSELQASGNAAKTGYIIHAKGSSFNANGDLKTDQVAMGTPLTIGNRTYTLASIDYACNGLQITES